MTDAREDREALAAEYVLGTLDARERAEAQLLMRNDAAFAALAAAWERRLSPLSDLTAPIEPPRDLLPAILARLDGPASGRPAEIVDLSARVRRWRRATWATGALAASLAALIVWREAAPPPPKPERFVAVLQRDAASPAFVVTVDIGQRSVAVRPVAAQAPADKSYELWLVHEQLPVPRSLGLVAEPAVVRPPALAGADAGLIRNALYAVSLEPKGGSPTGAPTGPVVFAGRLIPE